MTLPQLHLPSTTFVTAQLGVLFSTMDHERNVLLEKVFGGENSVGRTLKFRIDC